MSVSIIQRPEYNGFYARNTVPKFIIETNEAIWASLTITSNSTSQTFTTHYVPDFNDRIEIDFSQLYGDFFKTILPTADNVNSINQTFTSVIQCEASFVGSVSDVIPYPTGYPWIWAVCNAKLNSATPYMTWVQQNFLTNQPLEKYTTYDSPEWLTWLDPTNGARRLVARFYPKAGGSRDVTVRTDNTGGIFSEKVSYSRLIQMVNLLPEQLFGYYDLILTDLQANEICSQRYIFRERSGKEHYFLFANALGGIDTLICEGENVLQPETAHNVGRFGGNYVALDDTDDNRKWSQQTGMVPYRWRNWMHELLSSKLGTVFYNHEDGTLNPIVVTESDMSMSDNGQLASATFSYMMADASNVMADTERASDRILHQSVADEAEEPVDLTDTKEVDFGPAARGEGYETEVMELATTKIYVVFAKTAESVSVNYLIDGTHAGRFDLSSDDSPYVITIGDGTPVTVQFTSDDDVLQSLIVKYYPAQNA